MKKIGLILLAGLLLAEPVIAETDLLPASGVTSNVNIVSPGLASDDDTGTDWYGSGGPPDWIRVDLGSGKICDEVSITPKNSAPGNRIKGFTIAGSNNDTDWSDIYTGEHTDSDTKENFVFSNSTSYQYYRLMMNTTWAGTDVWLREWELFEKQNRRIILT